MPLGLARRVVDEVGPAVGALLVLCVVRDGSAGLGFWDDARRATVALTRARTRLVLVATRPEAWPADAPLRALALGA